jgi:hypothetical protein
MTTTTLITSAGGPQGTLQPGVAAPSGMPERQGFTCVVTGPTSGANVFGMAEIAASWDNGVTYLPYAELFAQGASPATQAAGIQFDRFSRPNAPTNYAARISMLSPGSTASLTMTT